MKTILDQAPSFEQIALYLAAMPDWKFRLTMLKMYIVSLDGQAIYINESGRKRRITGSDLIDDLVIYERVASGQRQKGKIPTSHRKLLAAIVRDVWELPNTRSESMTII